MGQLTQQEMKSRNDGQTCVCVGLRVFIAYMYSTQVCALRVSCMLDELCERWDDKRVRDCGILRDIDLVAFCYDGTI